MPFTFIACSDLHIRGNKPVARKDIFYSSVRRKLTWLFSSAQEMGAYIICGGDFFDSASAPKAIVRDVIELALRYNVKLLTVYGQHDLRYHVYKSYNNTPLAVLLSSLQTIHLDEQAYINDLVAIQGASWGKEIPDVVEDKVNILATHRMVTENGPLWANHTNFSTGSGLLNSTKYDIIVSGDNHQSFIVEDNNRFVINSGSLLRLNSTQIDYKPRVVLVTISDNKQITTEWLDVPIRPSAIVFKEEEIEEGNKRLSAVKDQLTDFTNQLNAYNVTKPDFMRNLIDYKSTVIDVEILDALDRILIRVDNKKG